MNKRTLQRIRVPLGLIFAVVFMVFADPTTMSIVIGGGITAIGLAIRAWASGHIRKARELASTGPYAYTRNPLYVGSFLIGAGFSIATGVWWLAVVFAALFLGLYLPVMRIEADDMREMFGSEYNEYSNHVPMFIPRFTPWRRKSIEWESGLYLKHREYEAAIGAALAFALLAVKAYVLS
ncbi:MAG: isoprenylcysteine carboxylmethyltransferase family protein [Chloracidobacterium sp.]|nr:isoprenylcysteine carboxylmethyltransferase family protein [Chloracidobacterium sp.]